MRKDKGIALILAIIVVTMVSLLLTSYVAMTVSERKRVEHEMAAGSAEYIARAGLERVFFDLSCEYEKDRSWIDDDRINGRIINNQNGDDIVDSGEGMPTVGSGTEDPTNRSDYQDFYGTIAPASRIAFADGRYWVEIAFVNNTADDAFLANRLWVRSTGTIYAPDGVTVRDQITLTQLARVRLVALVEADVATGNLLESVRLYDTLDNPSDSLVDNPEAVLDFPTDPNRQREIRISGATLNEDVLINTLGAADILMIGGGYDYTFSDGSRDTSKNVSTLEDSAGDTVVNITGSGTVIMGGVRIE